MSLPPIPNDGLFNVTATGLTSVMDTSPTTISFTFGSYYREEEYREAIQETKEEKQERIAKEKMHASWKHYNDRTATIQSIKSIGNKNYKQNFISRRFN